MKERRDTHTRTQREPHRKKQDQHTHASPPPPSFSALRHPSTTDSSAAMSGSSLSSIKQQQDQCHSNALFAQRVQGSLFLLMGGACVVFPRLLLQLSLRDFQASSSTDHHLLPLVFACFGAQACLCGLLLLTTQMNEQSFKMWALGMFPFIVFDVCFYQNGTLTAFGAGGDFVGNVIFILTSVYGAHACAAATTAAAAGEEKKKAAKNT